MKLGGDGLEFVVCLSSPLLRSLTRSPIGARKAILSAPFSDVPWGRLRNAHATASSATATAVEPSRCLPELSRPGFVLLCLRRLTPTAAAAATQWPQQR